MSEPVLLQAESLFKTYPSGDRSIDVLSGLDLSLIEGEAVAIIGDSGVGKSTLLHILGGLDPPDRGTVRFRGTDLYRESGKDLARYRNRDVGFIFQFHHLLPEFTARENVEMPFRIRHRDQTGQREATVLLERLGLAGRLDHVPGMLSGGEQQRVAIARALALRPSLVLADEPTGNLDPATGIELFRLLRELQAERPFALLLATHSERFARGCSRILRLSEGRLRALGDRETQEYFDGLGAGAAQGPML